jgi:hypothetical protein
MFSKSSGVTSRLLSSLKRIILNACPQADPSSKRNGTAMRSTSFWNYLQVFIFESTSIVSSPSCVTTCDQALAYTNQLRVNKSEKHCKASLPSAHPLIVLRSCWHPWILMQARVLVPKHRTLFRGSRTEGACECRYAHSVKSSCFEIAQRPSQ